MPLLTPDQPIAALRRALEAVPVEEKGAPLFVLRDLEDITTQAAALSPAGLALASCFDGKHTAAEVASLFSKHSGHLLKPEEVLGLAADLEKALLLETPQAQERRSQILRGFLQDPVRKAMGAGRDYPSEVLELSKSLGRFFQDPKGPGQGFVSDPAAPSPLGLIAPHIDFERGGPVYAWSYQTLSQSRPPDAIVALGVAHACPNSPWVMTRKSYATPYGEMALHSGLYDEIRAQLWYDPLEEEWVHRGEHSLELQAVWLRYLWREKTPPWVPILVSSYERFAPDRPPSAVATVDGAISKIAQGLRRRAQKGERIMVLAAVDLAHVGPRFGDEKAPTPESRRSTEEKDRASLDLALRLRSDDFYLSIVSDGNQRKVCGLSALYTATRLIAALAQDSPCVGKLLAYGQADDPAGGMVSFAGVVYPSGGL